MDTKMLHYNGLDAACMMEIYDSIWGDSGFQGHMPAYLRTMRMLDPIMYMQTRGIKVDFVGLEQTKKEATEKMNAAQEELNKIAGKVLNVNSPKQLQSYFYVEKGIAPYYDRKTKNVTTDDLAMARIARGIKGRPGLREASLVQEIRGYVKLIGTYLDIEFDADGRMHCSYKLRGTRMGRLSSAKTIYGTGTNNQNLPAEFKKFLIADEGHFFIELDKRQAEWVVVAFLAQDANMLDVIQNGRDPHTHTAHLMFNVDPDLIKREAKLVGSSSDSEYISQQRMSLEGLSGITGLPRSMSLRQCGKKSNHGLNYDEREYTFGLLNEIPQEEAKRIIALYHQIYPNIRENYYKDVQRDLGRDRTLENCFGRKYHFLEAWSDSLFKSAYSFLPQSTVVDSLNMGISDIYEDRRPHMSQIEILGQVHDSTLIQVPDAQLPALHRIVSDCYTALSPDMTYHGRTFKIATDMKIGRNWGTFHKDLNPNGMRELELGTNAEKFALSASMILGINEDDE